MALLKKGRKLLAAAGVLLIAGAIYYISQRGGDLVGLAAFGYPGVAILMFLTSSTIVLPAPGFAAVLVFGTVWNPLLVGIAAGLGAATGELTGYLLGVGGSTMLDVKHGKNWAMISSWLEKRGAIAILLLAATPNPFFDIGGMVAGSVGYPLRNFWFYCFVGKTIKYVALAYLSSGAASWWTLWH